MRGSANFISANNRKPEPPGSRSSYGWWRAGRSRISRTARIYNFEARRGHSSSSGDQRCRISSKAITARSVDQQAFCPYIMFQLTFRRLVTITGLCCYPLGKSTTKPSVSDTRVERLISFGSIQSEILWYLTPRVRLERISFHLLLCLRIEVIGALFRKRSLRPRKALSKS